MRGSCAALLTALVVTAFVSCSTSGAASRSEASSPHAQEIVDRLADEYPEIARLSIHAVPPGGSELRIVASSVAGRIGEPSDPEDLRSMRSGEPVVMHEGHNLDYTVAVRDGSGSAVAVIGITISGVAGESREARLARARTLADEAAREYVAAR
jgi:hypothetical protein